METVTSIPVPRPPFTASFTATPTGTVVSYGAYTWAEQHLKDASGNEVVPTVVTVPAMYHHSINTALTFTAIVTPALGIPNITEFYWDFGDGVKITTTSPTITHTYRYDAPGTIAHLKATDSFGISAWSSMNMMLTP